ncbi:sulfite exporter TauE/SafE family protein [Streptomyces hainanensis]|uniref:sulfite exporter TauE/SafE family protein n=1 Tax=Streptomyces hainanensis TaxID=402648 RepID=UPI002442252D|nr:sulfite exporter TauE/SafE family protein [Streptomyces hainanensis]
MSGTAQLVLFGAVTLGALVQWMTGMGFALVAAPVLVLLLGPGDGVALANCVAGVICLVGLAGGWRRVRLGAMVPLVVASACTVPAGVWVAGNLPEPLVLAGLGCLVTLAVLLVMWGTRAPALGGVGGALTAGAAGGFMNASAGVGGPPVSLYAMNAGWSVREFVPNAQFYGIVVNVFSVAANGLPELGGGRVWWLAGAALAVGSVLGRALTERVPERRARHLVLSLALTGGVTTLVKGLLAA